MAVLLNLPQATVSLADDTHEHVAAGELRSVPLESAEQCDGQRNADAHRLPPYLAQAERPRRGRDRTSARPVGRRELCASFSAALVGVRRAA
jgi:hypothetical protein